MSSDRLRKYTFGKLENVPKSATEKHLFYLPLKKDDKLRANGKIHMGWLSYPNIHNKNPDLSTIWAGKLCQGDNNWDEMDVKDFKDKVNVYYPLLLEEFWTDRYGIERENVTDVQNNKNAHLIYEKLVSEGMVCKKCQEEHPLYVEGYFFNPKGQIKESESKREALNRAKGLNEMVIIERIRNFKEHDIISKFKFGKLNNPAKSASESLLFALPVKKDGQMKDKGKIHIGSFNSSHLDDVNPSNSDYYPFTYAGNTCQLIEGKEKKIPISDFKDKTSLYYPISIEDIIVSKDGEIINKRIYTVTRNLEAQTFAERFWWQNKLFCQKCHNYCLMRGINKEDYFINPNRQIYESESKTNSELQKHFDILDKDKKEESIGELVDWDRKPKEPAYFEDVEWGQNSDD